MPFVQRQVWQPAQGRQRPGQRALRVQAQPPPTQVVHQPAGINCDVIARSSSQPASAVVKEQLEKVLQTASERQQGPDRQVVEGAPVASQPGLRHSGSRHQRDHGLERRRRGRREVGDGGAGAEHPPEADAGADGSGGELPERDDLREHDDHRDRLVDDQQRDEHVERHDERNQLVGSLVGQQRLHGAVREGHEGKGGENAGRKGRERVQGDQKVQAVQLFPQEEASARDRLRNLVRFAPFGRPEERKFQAAKSSTCPIQTSKAWFF